MTTYNTGNPIGSTDPRDLYDNAQNLDTAMHTAATTWADRLGNSRPSWAGATGYQSLGDYAAGIQVTTYNQVIRASGEYWRAAAGTVLPYTTTGAGMPESGKFVSVGDAMLRADLVDGDGSSLVGFQQSGTGSVLRTAQDKMREWVSVKDFGAVGDGVTDDTAAIQAAVNSGAKNIYVPAGDYLIGSTVVVPIRVSLIGENAYTTRFLVSASGTYTANAMFLFNTTNGVTWVTSYPNIGSGKLKNVAFDNASANLPNIIGAIFAGSYVIEDVRGWKMFRIIQTTSDYTDSVEIRRVISFEAGTGSQIRVNQLGDGLIIEGCHFVLRFSDNSNPFGLEVIGSTGGVIKDIIAGNHRVYRCANVAIERPHLEGATLTIDSSSVSVIGMFTTPNEENQPNIRLLSTDDGRYAVTIDGYQNAIWDNRIPTTYNRYDIQTHGNYEITIRNCFKRAYRSGDIAVSEIMGVLLLQQNGTDFTTFNNLSHHLSAYCRIQRGQRVLLNEVIPCGSGGPYILSNTVTTSAVVLWREASGTYFYRAQLVYDVVRRIGQPDNNTETSFVRTNGGNGLIHVPDYQSRNPNVILRLYRGTSTGSYDMYVDIPVVSAMYFYDDGFVVNGHPWLPRTAGGTDAMNAVASQVELRGSRAKIISTSTPTVGTYAAGDQVEYASPAAGGNIGIVCTAAGTPGTWKTFGAIAP